MGAVCCCWPIPTAPDFACVPQFDPNDEVVVEVPKLGVVDVPNAGVVVAGFVVFPNPLNENPPVLILNDDPTRELSPYLWRNWSLKKYQKSL